jgi:hypothetical protein
MKTLKTFEKFVNESIDASKEVIEEVDALSKTEKFNIWIHYCGIMASMKATPMIEYKDKPEWSKGHDKPQFDTETMALYFPCREFETREFKDFCKEKIYEWYWKYYEELLAQNIITTEEDDDIEWTNDKDMKKVKRLGYSNEFGDYKYRRKRHEHVKK